MSIDGNSWMKLLNESISCLELRDERPDNIIWQNFWQRRANELADDARRAKKRQQRDERIT